MSEQDRDRYRLGTTVQDDIDDVIARWRLKREDRSSSEREASDPCGTA